MRSGALFFILSLFSLFSSASHFLITSSRNCKVTKLLAPVLPYRANDINMLRRVKVSLVQKDFDAWAYNICWPQSRILSPVTGKVDFVVEDVKFAYNAWCLLRLALFFGVRHPKILSPMTSTTPSMDIALAGNRLFFMHSCVEAKMDSSKVRIALTPNHINAFPIQEFSWERHCSLYHPNATGVELVLGMENGLSEKLVNSCDHCVYIPQYGSIGSLSMLSALAIATHATSRSYQRIVVDHATPSPTTHVPSHGHMPLSSNPHPKGTQLPHEADLLSCSNREIRQILTSRRQTYPLQLSVMMYNNLGDRNIGAVMRNANVFNCEHVLIVNRKRFNRRGAVGAHKVLDVSFVESVHEQTAQYLLAEYEVWLLYPYYPNLVIYGSENSESNPDTASTFIRHGDPLLQKWCASHHSLTPDHPLAGAHPHLAIEPVFLDNDESLMKAVRRVKKKKLRGIMLAVPEEGCSPHPTFGNVSQRVVYVSNPEHLPLEAQRGLNPALSTAVGLERIRCAIDGLAVY